jgi:uncharacterized protein
VMKETLGETLSSLFMETGPETLAANPETATPSAHAGADRAREALDHYNQAFERLKSGDWTGFGTQLDVVRELLEEMSRQSGGH